MKESIKKEIRDNILERLKFSERITALKESNRLASIDNNKLIEINLLNANMSYDDFDSLMDELKHYHIINHNDEIKIRNLINYNSLKDDSFELKEEIASIINKTNWKDIKRSLLKQKSDDIYNNYLLSRAYFIFQQNFVM